MPVKDKEKASNKKGIISFILNMLQGKALIGENLEKS